MARFQCDRCKKQFTTEHGAKMHARAKHKKTTEVVEVPPYTDDDVPSYASLVVDAIHDRACGDPVDDDLLEFIEKYEPR